MSHDWPRVTALFEAALERPGDERERFVTEQAAGDDALCQEVLSLIGAHVRAGSFLEAPAQQLGISRPPLANRHRRCVAR